MAITTLASRAARAPLARPLLRDSPLRSLRPAVRPAARAFRRASTTAASALAVGKPLPLDVELSYFDQENTLQRKSLRDITANRTAVLVGVPGAFTPTCTEKHAPAFVELADELKAAGADLVAIVAVNDPFVMRAWGHELGAAGRVLMLADGSADFARAAGIELDLSDKGLGVRMRRFALVADNGVVTDLHLENGGALKESTAERILKDLRD